MIETFSSYCTLIMFTLIFSYGILNISIIIGWFKLLRHDQKTSTSNFKQFSILIPMRNEANNILNILADINAQNYPKEHFEIIVIDDKSEDNSLELLKACEISNLKIIQNDGEGKKSALSTGIQIASNEYIIQTDADCRIKKNWIHSINQYLNKHDAKLLAAPVIIKKQNSIFSNFQELDFMALMMSTAGLVGIQYPVMVNGANLIYPKSVLKNYDILNNNSVSGDDVFLLHYIKKEYGRKSVHFLNSMDSTVETYAISPKSFFHQRIRWASKSRLYKDFDTILIGALILFTNLFLATLFVSSFFSTDIQNIFIIFFISKAIIDLVLLIPILTFYKRLSLLIYFPILSFLYLFYASFVGIISQLVSFEWKNRTYN